MILAKLVQVSIQGKPERVTEGFAQVIHRAKLTLGIIRPLKLKVAERGNLIPILFTNG